MDEQLFYSKIQFASLVRQGEEPSKALDPRGRADRLASCIAILAARDSDAVAARVRLEEGGATVTLAKNGGWPQSTMKYVNDVGKILQELSMGSNGESPHGNSGGVQRLKSLVEKFCGAKYAKKLRKLRERVEAGSFEDIARGLPGYPSLVRHLMEEESIWKASGRCRVFHSKCRDEKSPLLHKISRMATLYVAFNCAVSCASKREYSYAFTNHKFRYLPAQQDTYTLVHWENLLEEYEADFEARKRMVSYYNADHGFQLESRNVYPPDPYRLSKVNMHAEMLVVMDIFSGPHDAREFVGVSKSCCVLCYHFLEGLRTVGGEVHVRSAHGKLYPGWMLPTLGNPAWDRKLREHMGVYVDGWVGKGLGRARSTLLAPDSDSCSANSYDTNYATSDLGSDEDTVGGLAALLESEAAILL